MRNTERDRDMAEEEAGSLRGALCRTPSQDPGITPWAQERCSTPEPPGAPKYLFLIAAEEP